MDRNVFDNPALYSQYLSYSGMRVNASGTKPSIYITEIKLRRTIKEMSVNDINAILKPDTAFNPIAVDHKKKAMLSKVESLHEWQLLHALDLLVEVGRIECVAYIFKCKRSDKETKSQ